jgi:Ca2+-binding RTX toxin-like protein
MADNVINIDVLSGVSEVAVLQAPSIEWGTLSIIGGADAAAFSFTFDGASSTNAHLMFLTPPDVARPADVGADNVYQLEILANNAGVSTTTSYNIHVVSDDYSDRTDTLASLTAGGAPVAGVMNTARDADWFKFTVAAGDYLVDVTGVSIVGVRAADGSLVSQFTASTPTPRVSLTAGSYFLEVGSSTLDHATGAYTATVRSAISSPTPGGEGPDFRSGSELDEQLLGNGGADTLNGNGGQDTIHGGTGDDQLNGGAGHDQIFGEAGNDSIDGGDGADTLDGGDGADTIDGGTGADSILCGAGDDVVRGLDDPDNIDGGAGADDLNGNRGEDTVHGGDDADFLRGGQGNDLVYGDAGDDVMVNGNLGDDTVDGGLGADGVYGGQGNDRLFGGAGDDYLSGDLGSDTLTGGTGADSFRLGANGGHDFITDFNVGEGDRVVVDRGYSYSVAQSGSDTLITLNTGEQLTLQGVTASSLPTGWIVSS